MRKFITNRLRGIPKFGLLILFILIGVSSYAQNTVIGTVTDSATGEGLPGATVLVKGSTAGTVTDIEGKFSIDIASEGTLIMSFIGYTTKEVPINGRSIITVVLEEDIDVLSEVVVVGYGNQRRETLTGSVATVESKDLTVVPSPNLQQNLQGRMPGLIVNMGQGRPGADGANISIRGFGSNGGAGRGNQNESPLVIVDGFQRDFSQLDPNEVESITILKDASAAVYGVRAGAGVILVTTKKGKSGKPTISFNSSTSLTDFTSFPEVANYQGYLKAVLQHRDGSNDGVVNNITSERLALLEAGDPGTDWFDVITKRFAPQQQYNFNIRGGSDRVRYFTSLGYLDQGTVWESGDFGYKRYNGSVNLDFDVTDNLTAGVQLGWRREMRSEDRTFESSDLYSIAYSNPAFPSSLPDPDRVPGANIDNPRSPISATYRDVAGYNDTRTDNINTSVDLTYKIPGVEGLSVTGTVGYLQTYQFRTVLSKPYTLWYLNDDGYKSQTGREQTTLSEQAYRFERVTSNIRANYAKSFGSHNFSALVLYEQISEEARDFSANGNDLLSPATPFLFANNPDFATISGGGSELGRTGLVGRLNYDFEGTYIVSLSFRQDKSAFFPVDSRTGFFPGISAGWVLSNEKFLQESKVITFLKLRGSYSRLGNDGANSYDYIDGFEQIRGEAGYVFNGKYQSAIRTLGIPNPRITWQLSDLYNAGIDVNFLNNRLGLEFDAFYRKRSQLLAVDPGVVIVGTTGAELPLENVESRDNRGVELALNFRGGERDLKYNFSANGSWAREKWVKYVGDPTSFVTDDRERINKQSGNWVNRTFGYVFDGFFTEQEIEGLTMDYFNGQEKNLRSGDIKIKDTNGDGVIDQDDRILIGRNNVPEIIYGFNTDLKYKNWDFTLFLQGASNFNQNFNGQQRGISVVNSGTATPYQYIVDNLWTPEGPNTGVEFPRDITGPTNDLLLDKYYKNSSYLRLKNLVIGYSIPRDVISRIGVQNVRLSLSGTNLLTFDKLGLYPWDAETGGVNNYPAQRVYTLGLNVSF
ncbi:TonB-linked SusC/RagA family outer membrane protein [Algoriphagus ratkowskyi]|uniref:TonB-dependent receptor n=1 Tax=Algoriphagus ratkowskyi TaxID=57028 RepID=A0A2W7QTC8_9BACT|nr:TonB-dependent receptor [Algoriphagus ratkowskyi]PZX51241.1 TonB-linked SusC/RagA family outer membrane protein [Algoriphagus ratkowskyi]TXD75965.1 TonB-dependent receptor [Algoriphagus ratkowskyi]